MERMDQVTVTQSGWDKVDFGEYVLSLFYVYGCMHTVRVSATHRGQGLSDPLELELRMVVNYYVGAGNQTRVLCKGSKCSNH